MLLDHQFLKFLVRVTLKLIIHMTQSLSLCMSNNFLSSCAKKIAKKVECHFNLYKKLELSLAFSKQFAYIIKIVLIRTIIYQSFRIIQ